MTKRELRKVYLEKRRELSTEAFHKLNEQLCDRFFSEAHVSSFHVLHTFLPIEKNREVDTWLIIDRLRNAFPATKIAIPRINNHTAELEHYYFESREHLENNTWGIPEPVKGIPVAAEKIDAVLVPLLAFDRQGHRIGYGRGFYDRFLSQCRPDCIKIGLSLFAPEEKIDDTSEKDIPLDIVITPQETFRIRKVW